MTSDVGQGEPNASPTGGIFTTPHFSLRLHGFKLIIGPDGEVSAEGSLQTATDMWPFWVEIAMDHLKSAATGHAAVAISAGSGDGSALGAALEEEFKASMQAIVAAAVALDAFYARIKEAIVLPTSLVSDWRHNRTSRYKQVREVLRRAFALKPPSVAGLATILKDIYRFRNLAAHPAATFAEAVRRQDLSVATDWRYVAFCFPSAQAIVGAVTSIIAQCVSKEKVGPEGLAQYCQAAKPQAMVWAERWEKEYGVVFPREEKAT